MPDPREYAEGHVNLIIRTVLDRASVSAEVASQITAAAKELDWIFGAYVDSVRTRDDWRSVTVQSRRPDGWTGHHKSAQFFFAPSDHFDTELRRLHTKGCEFSIFFIRDNENSFGNKVVDIEVH